MIKEIRTAVLLEMHVHEKPDTTPNRIMFCQMLRKRWLEEPKKSGVKTRYIGTLNMEILRLQMKEEMETRTKDYYNPECMRAVSAEENALRKSSNVDG